MFQLKHILQPVGIITKLPESGVSCGNTTDFGVAENQLSPQDTDDPPPPQTKWYWHTAYQMQVCLFYLYILLFNGTTSVEDLASLDIISCQKSHAILDVKHVLLGVHVSQYLFYLLLMPYYQNIKYLSILFYLITDVPAFLFRSPDRVMFHTHLE